MLSVPTLMKDMLENYVEHFLSLSCISAPIAIAVLLLIVVYHVVKDWGLPPGPTGFPFLGYWPFLKKDSVHLQFQEMKEKYGDVFSFRMFGQLYINLGSIKAIREAHVANSDSFAERNTDFSFLSSTFEEGLISANGEAWKALRKFFTQALREQGMTSLKDNMVGPVYDNLNVLIDDLRAKNGKPANLINTLTEKCSSIIRRMIFNDDGISEEELQEFIEEYKVVTECFTSIYVLISGKFVRYFMLPFIPVFRNALKAHKRMNIILHEVVRRHESSFDESNIRDVIDSYIKERRDRQRKNDPTAKYFTDKALVSSLHQLVGDGILAVAGFIGLFLSYLIEYPEEQEKIYAELLEVVGADRQPTLEDRSKLSYTNAFLSEILRHANFLPLFPSLRSTKETTLRGYRIPKGTMTVANFYSAHFDPEIFDEPQKFKPERYVTGAEKKKPELPVVFGVGRRSCSGEAFTMMQVFLYVTTLIKNFRLSLPAGVPGNISELIFSGKMEVCAHPRMNN